MMNITIKPWDEHQEIPYELLFLADPSKELVDEYIARGRCFGAYLDNEMVGEFVLIHTHPKTIELVNIAVKEEMQGKGIGKLMVLRAIEEARNLQAKSIEIGTGNSSFIQLKLYQTCGFRIFGVDTDFFVRNYTEELYEDGIQIKDMIRLRVDL